MRRSKDQDWEAAQLALQQVGEWVRQADTKTTILTAAIGVLVAALTTQAEPVAKALRAYPDCGHLALLVVLAASLTISLVASSISLVPRFGGPSPTNQFSWPWHAQQERPVTRFVTEPTADAWAQVHGLSKLARTKYRAFRIALFSFGIATVFAVIELSFAAWATTG